MGQLYGRSGEGEALLASSEEALVMKRRQILPDPVLSSSEEETSVETSHTVVVSGAVMTEEALKDHSNHYIMSSGVPGSQFQTVEVRISAFSPSQAAV